MTSVHVVPTRHGRTWSFEIKLIPANQRGGFVRLVTAKLTSWDELTSSRMVNQRTKQWTHGIYLILWSAGQNLIIVHWIPELDFQLTDICLKIWNWNIIAPITSRASYFIVTPVFGLYKIRFQSIKVQGHSLIESPLFSHNIIRITIVK